MIIHTDNLPILPVFESNGKGTTATPLSAKTVANASFLITINSANFSTGMDYDTKLQPRNVLNLEELQTSCCAIHNVSTLLRSHFSIRPPTETMVLTFRATVYFLTDDLNSMA